MRRRICATKLTYSQAVRSLKHERDIRRRDFLALGRRLGRRRVHTLSNATPNLPNARTGHPCMCCHNSFWDDLKSVLLSLLPSIR